MPLSATGLTAAARPRLRARDGPLRAGVNDIDHIDDINNINNNIDNVNDIDNIDDTRTMPRPVFMDVFQWGVVTLGQYLHGHVPGLRAASRRVRRRRSG
jgi:hypothetical protein